MSDPTPRPRSRRTRTPAPPDGPWVVVLKSWPHEYRRWRLCLADRYATAEEAQAAAEQLPAETCTDAEAMPLAVAERRKLVSHPDGPDKPLPTAAQVVENARSFRRAILGTPPSADPGTTPAA